MRLSIDVTLERENETTGERENVELLVSAFMYRERDTHHVDTWHHRPKIALTQNEIDDIEQQLWDEANS